MTYNKIFQKIAVLFCTLFLLSCNTNLTSNPPKTDQNNTPNDQNIDKPSIDKNLPILPSNYQKMLKSGIDVDWCKTDQGRFYAKKSHENGINVAKIFKQRGFSHVRIRIKNSVLDDTSLLHEIKNMIDDSIEADIIPIIAYQAADFKDNPTDEQTLNDVIAWWTKVAKEFKNYPYTLAYDLVIETTGAVKKHNDRLNLLYDKTTKEIRKIDPNRIIIIAPNKISNPYELDNLIVPTPTTYMMIEWHFYAAGPKKTNPKKQWTTGTDDEKKLILDKINYAYNYSKENNISIWVGAWMANNYNDINKDKTFLDGAPAGGEYSIKEQIIFASFMAKSLQSKNIPYAINSDTKYFDRENNKWYKSVSEVLDIIIWK